MIFEDYHIHTTFCDGNNTPEEMVLSAIEKGMKNLGFSGHSYTFFDESYCMKKEAVEEYKREIHRLKEKYKDRINIFCGVEQDFYSTESTQGFDYVIASVHYVKKGDEYLPVDDKPVFADNINRYYGGDYLAFCEDYYETVSRIEYGDIIGHIDLVTKFNEDFCLFDEGDSRYVNAWRKAVDKLLKLGIPFEINTGAISRGYRTTPYPRMDILNYIKDNNGKIILSGDAHSADGIMNEFEKYQNLTNYSIMGEFKNEKR